MSGLFETTSEFGGALGIALLGSILAAGYRSHVDELLPAGLDRRDHATAHDSLAGAVVASAHAPGQVGAAILHAGRTAYLSGMRLTEVVAAVTMLAMALVTARLLRGGEPAPAVLPRRNLTLTRREASQWCP